MSKNYENMLKDMARVYREVQLELVRRYGDSYKLPRSKAWSSQLSHKQNRQRFKQRRGDDRNILD